MEVISLQQFCIEHNFKRTLVIIVFIIYLFFLKATGILNLLVVNFSDLANNIVCVERIKEYYTDVSSEVIPRLGLMNSER